MQALLALATGPKKWIAIGFAVLLAALYVGWLHLSIAWLERDLAASEANLATARDNVAKALEVNAGNLAELDKMRADSTAVRRALGGELAALERRCTETRTIKREVSRVTSQTPAVCPVAPSVRAALRGLQPDPGSADRDEDRARASGAAGGAAGLSR